jgi:cell cycle arrest protein BUB3
MSSIEGRVAVEYFDMSPAAQAGKYAFKCHRSTVNETQYVFPVNALAFHPVWGTFATGGCDGLVAVWDGELKKRVAQLPAFPTSVAALDFSHDGALLAVAASYTFEEGEKECVSRTVFTCCLIPACLSAFEFFSLSLE